MVNDVFVQLRHNERQQMLHVWALLTMGQSHFRVQGGKWQSSSDGECGGCVGQYGSQISGKDVIVDAGTLNLFRWIEMRCVFAEVWE